MDRRIFMSFADTMIGNLSLVGHVFVHFQVCAISYPLHFFMKGIETHSMFGMFGLLRCFRVAVGMRRECFSTSGQAHCTRLSCDQVMHHLSCHSICRRSRTDFVAERVDWYIFRCFLR